MKKETMDEYFCYKIEKLENRMDALTSHLNSAINGLNDLAKVVYEIKRKLEEKQKDSDN